MLTCGVVSYLNTLPLLAPFLLKKLSTKKAESTAIGFYSACPRDLNRAMEKNILPISFVSSSFYLKNQDSYELIKGIGIGCQSKVQSVCLFYPKELTSFQGATVLLDPESATSNEIVKWLIESVKGQTPRYITSGKADAFLLIGDRALNFIPPNNYCRMDIGEEWVQATGLPLPFAVLVANKAWKKKHPEVPSKIVKTFKEGVSWSFNHLEELIPLAKNKSLLDEKLLKNYWNGLSYLFDEPFYEALHLMGIK